MTTKLSETDEIFNILTATSAATAAATRAAPAATLVGPGYSFICFFACAGVFAVFVGLRTGVLGSVGKTTGLGKPEQKCAAPKS